MASSLRRVIRRASPRIFTPSRVEDIRSPAGSSPNQSIDSMNAVRISDHITYLVASQKEPAAENSLIELGDRSLHSACERLTELADDMDPVLLTRCLSKVSRVESLPDEVIQKLSRRVMQRIPDMPLGCLTRLVFVLAGRLDSESSHRLFRKSSARILELTSQFDTVPPRVIAKLFVALPRLQGDSRNTFLWERLESFALHGVQQMEPDQVQQVAFGITQRSSFENACLVSALLRRSCYVVDQADIQTVMALLVSLSRLPKKSEDEELWCLYKKLCRDKIGLKEGFFPIGLLKTLLSRQNGAFTDHQLRRIRNSLKM